MMGKIKAIVTKVRRRIRPGIFSIHCIDHTNIGDMACSPFNYFSSETPVYPMNFWEVDAGSVPQPDTLPIVLGGGGLYYAPATIERLVQRHKGPLVAWGVGRNGKLSENDSVYPGAGKFAIFGVRDWDSGHDWVPCASCMSPLINRYRAMPPEHPMVFYGHKDHRIEIAATPCEYNNISTLEKALRFIASGESVLTNSYHGAYWAQLLGRKVAAIPLGNRFTGFRFPVKLTTLESWPADIGRASAAPEALEVCRAKTLDFSRRVEDRLGISLQLRS